MYSLLSKQWHLLGGQLMIYPIQTVITWPIID